MLCRLSRPRTRWSWRTWWTRSRQATEDRITGCLLCAVYFSLCRGTAKQALRTIARARRGTASNVQFVALSVFILVFGRLAVVQGSIAVVVHDHARSTRFLCFLSSRECAFASRSVPLSAFPFFKARILQLAAWVSGREPVTATRSNEINDGMLQYS